jgi:beta-glucosidase
VLVKNANNTLPLGKPTMLSIFGYDAGPPPTKNIDVLFQLGYESEPEMAEATLGYEAHFSQYAPEGVIFAGGRSGSNGPAYIDSVSHREAKHLLPAWPAMRDDTG